MDSQSGRSWGGRMSSESGAGEQSSGRLIRDAGAVVRGRLTEVARVGIQPLLQEAATQVRPATVEELRARYPGLTDDEVARRLIERAARTAAAVALAIGGILAAQEAVAVASAAVPPAGGTAIGAIGVTALAEVLALFVIEAKLRADPGGFARLRRRSLRRALPEAAVRRTAARIAAMIPARFARIVIPEVVAPLVGSAFAARLATRQVRAAGERHWGELRLLPRTSATWRPATDDGEAPWNGSAGPGRRALPPPDDTWHPHA